MAVISVEPSMDEWTGDRSKGFKRNFSYPLLVECDSPKDGPLTIWRDSRIPRIGSVYELGNDRDPGSRLVKILPKRESNSSRHWKVMLQYSTDGGELETDAAEQDPTQRPIEIWGEWEDIEEPLEQDKDGNPIESSSQEALDPPPTETISYPIVCFGRWESDWPVGKAVQYRNAINSDTFADQPPRHCQIRDITYRSEQFEDGLIWKVTYKLLFKDKEIIREFLDQGTRFWDADKEKWVKFVGDGLIGEVRKLNGEGQELTEGGHFLKFYTKKELPFSNLNLT
ncbi:Hypothetical protein PBC10988_23080 [Planctomycetales bacterium 10988]|nr:Hypothetical protein PBC10988_23080 [Planctomycetales bacterium 10988]